MSSSIVQVFRSTLNNIPQWISKPQIKRSFKHQKGSNGAGRFARSLHKCKNSQYDVRSCKSSRHNRRHSFKRHRPRHKSIPSNIAYDGLKVKERKGYTSPSPCGQIRMLRATITIHIQTLVHCFQ